MFIIITFILKVSQDDANFTTFTLSKFLDCSLENYFCSIYKRRIRQPRTNIKVFVTRLCGKNELISEKELCLDFLDFLLIVGMSG